MKQDIRYRYQRRARFMKALAHPTRLFLIDELARGERCVCELTAMVGDDISTISKHLSLLREAGIVSDEKRGNMVFYSLRTPCVQSFFTCFEKAVAEAEVLEMERTACETSLTTGAARAGSRPPAATKTSQGSKSQCSITTEAST